MAAAVCWERSSSVCPRLSLLPWLSFPFSEHSKCQYLQGFLPRNLGDVLVQGMLGAKFRNFSLSHWQARVCFESSRETWLMQLRWMRNFNAFLWISQKFFFSFCIYKISLHLFNAAFVVSIKELSKLATSDGKAMFGGTQVLRIANKPDWGSLLRASS